MNKKAIHPKYTKASWLALAGSMVLPIPVIGLANFILRKKIHQLLTEMKEETTATSAEKYRQISPFAYKIIYHGPTINLGLNILFTIFIIGFYFWFDYAISNGF